MSTPGISAEPHTPFIEPITGDQLEQIAREPEPVKPTSSSKNRKLIWLSVAIFFGILLISGVIIWFFNYRNGSSTATPSPTPVKKRVVEPTNVIDVAQRPVVFLVPEADGRNITVRVVAVKKPASSAEYELEYQAGELLQGVNGKLDLSSLPAKTTQLMGSCSAGGKCSYHENVKGGSILLRFLGDENYVLKQDWKYIDNKAKESAFSSKDAKFQIDSPDLKTTRYLIIYNSPGYAEGLTAAVVSDPYALQTSSELKGKAMLTMRANEEGNLVIMGFDGTTWKEFTGTVDGKMVTADVDLMPLYVVVKKN